MAISFVGTQSAGTISGGDVTVSLTTLINGSDSAPVQNDLVLVVGGIGDNDGVDFVMAMITSGYTLVPGSEVHVDDTQDVDIAVFYKFMGSTPDTTAVFDGQGGADAACAAVAMAFRGVDQTTPFDVASVLATGLNTQHPDPGSIDWSTSGSWVVIAAASGTTTPTGTGVGGYTWPTGGYSTDGRSHSTIDTSDVIVGMAYDDTPGDPENPGVITAVGTDGTGFCWAAVTMALREASAPAGQTLNGTLFTKAPTFFTGGLTSVYTLTGTTYVKAPTFFAGTLTPGPVTLSGVLFSKAPTFFQGSLTQISPQTLEGVLFQKAPTFFTGGLTSVVTLAGTTFTTAPTFFVGTLTLADGGEPGEGAMDSGLTYGFLGPGLVATVISWTGKK